MPESPQKDRPAIQEHLINSLMAVNDDEQLSYLIKEIEKVKIAREADIFILITLCLSEYPAIINHLRRKNLENLYDACFSQAKAQDLFEILEIPANSKIKEFIYAYIKQLTDQYKMKTQPSPRHLLDVFVQFIIETNRPLDKNPPKLLRYLIQDYTNFTAKQQEAEQVKLGKPLTRL